MDGLLPKVNSKLPAVSPAIKYAHHPEYQHTISAWLGLNTAHLPVQEFAVAAIYVVLDPASAGKTRYLVPLFRRWIPQKISTRHSTGWLIAVKSLFAESRDRQRYARYVQTAF